MKKILLTSIILGSLMIGCPVDNQTKSDTQKTVSQANVPATEQANPTPEPTTLVLLGSGIIGLAILGRNKFKK